MNTAWVAIPFLTLLILVLSEKRRIVDLTHQLKPDGPVFPIFDNFNLTPVVRGQMENYWMEINWISTLEHTGTHMDAPAHFSKGNLRMHEVPIERFIGPGVIIRVVDKVRENLDYQVTVDDILMWENKHGPIPEGAILIMDSGWTHRWPDPSAVFGTSNPKDMRTFHGPSFSEEAARFIVDKRPQVSIVGVDAFSPDAAQTQTFSVHVTLLGAGVLILENVANVDQVPESGAMIYCMPLNIHDGSGSPIRAFAVINDDVMKPESQRMCAGTSTLKQTSLLCVILFITFIFF